MSLSLSKIREVNSNFDKSSVTNPVGVFVGATSGIGESTAYGFAKVTINPTIYIVGRNKEAGVKIKAKIEELNSTAKVHFLQHDLTYIEQAERVANVIRNNEDKVNTLVLSQAGICNTTRMETEEGLDVKFALCYYSRWTIANLLIPLLEVAQQKGEPARVLSILSAVDNVPIDLDDLEVKKNYTLLNSYYLTSTYNTIATLKFAREYPKLSFIHSYPGFVKSKANSYLPFYYRYIADFVGLFIADSCETSAEKHLYLAYTGSEFASSGHLVNQHLVEVDQSVAPYTGYTEEVQDKLWKHTEEMIHKANQADVIKK